MAGLGSFPIESLIKAAMRRNRNDLDAFANGFPKPYAENLYLLFEKIGAERAEKCSYGLGIFVSRVIQKHLQDKFVYLDVTPIDGHIVIGAESEIESYVYVNGTVDAACMSCTGGVFMINGNVRMAAVSICSDLSLFVKGYVGKSAIDWSNNCVVKAEEFRMPICNESKNCFVISGKPIKLKPCENCKFVVGEINDEVAMNLLKCKTSEDYQILLYEEFLQR